MSLIFAIPDEMTALAHALADAAGGVIKPYFRALREVEIKSDASPVTQADKEAESAIRDLLRRHRPDDGIWGEEHGAERMDAEWVWTIDPIDGTRAFVTGKPLFGTLIGLLHQGMPVFGILDQCITQERWSGGVGRPALLNGKPARARACPNLADAYLNATTPDMFKPDELAAFRTLGAQARDTTFGGDCYAYGLLASGHIDLVTEAPLRLHDYAALVPIVTAAGGVMTDWEGKPLTKDSGGPHGGRVLAAGDPFLHARAVGVLRTALGKAA